MLIAKLTSIFRLNEAIGGTFRYLSGSWSTFVISRNSHEIFYFVIRKIRGKYRETEIINFAKTNSSI